MGIWRRLGFGRRRHSRVFPEIEVSKGHVEEIKVLRSSTPGSSPSESTTGSATHSEEDVISLRSPSPEELISVSQELVNLQASPEEIAEAVEEEFGHEVAQQLQSSKWDQRQRALQSISASLNGWMEPALRSLGRERRHAWRAACQVLSHVLKDKVLPVKLASLQLFRDTFENIDAEVTAEEVQHALDHLLDCVMPHLGDSHVRLHELAVSDLVFARYLLGDKLLHRLRLFVEASGERSKTFGALDTVNSLLNTCPTSPWCFEDLSIFVTLGMEEGGPRCRNRALDLAMTLYRLHGPACVPRLLQPLRENKQKLLREKFRAIDEEHPRKRDQGEPTHLDVLLRGLATPGDEEFFMDGILEETGQVFAGSDLRRRKSVSFSNTDDIVEVEREEVEEVVTEHELLDLGLLDLEEDAETLLREILMDEESPHSDSQRWPAISRSGADLLGPSSLA